MNKVSDIRDFDLQLAILIRARVINIDDPFLDRQIWYLCEVAQRCDRAIYLTVIDVAVASGRSMIIRVDYEDPSADAPRRSYGICERGKWRRTRKATERGLLSRIDFSSEDGIRSFSIKIGRIHASHDFRRHEVEATLVFTADPASHLAGRYVSYLSHRAVGPSITLQTRSELLSPVSCFAAALDAACFFGFIINLELAEAAVNRLISTREREKERDRDR